jgi:hypothetical protein
MIKQLHGSADNAPQDLWTPESGIKLNTIPTVIRVDDDVTGKPIYTIEPATTTDPVPLPPVLETTITNSTSTGVVNEYAPPDSDPRYLGPTEKGDGTATVIDMVAPPQTSDKITPLPVQSASFPSWLIWLGIGIGAWMIFKPRNRKE